jgi:HEAT repeat protein
MATTPTFRFLTIGRVALLSAFLLSPACHGKRPPYQDKSVAELERMLGDPDPVVQAQGAFGLSQAGEKALPAVPALSEALKSKESQVRQNAALALGRIGPQARAALAPLTEVLQDEDWPVRRQAAIALGHLHEEAKPALPALEKLAGVDTNTQVRKVAREAIAKIRNTSRSSSPAARTNPAN